MIKRFSLSVLIGLAMSALPAGAVSSPKPEKVSRLVAPDIHPKSCKCGFFCFCGPVCSVVCGK